MDQNVILLELTRIVDTTSSGDDLSKAKEFISIIESGEDVSKSLILKFMNEAQENIITC